MLTMLNVAFTLSVNAIYIMAVPKSCPSCERHVIVSRLVPSTGLSNNHVYGEMKMQTKNPSMFL